MGVLRAAFKAVKRLSPGKSGVSARLAGATNKIKAKIGTGINPHLAKRHAKIAKMQTKVGQSRQALKHKAAVGGVVAGVGTAVAGAHVASYKHNKKRAQQGKAPSLWLRSTSGNLGYREGMKKRTKG